MAAISRKARATQVLEKMLEETLGIPKLVYLRKKFATEDITIIDLAKQEKLPPCLTYAAVTPVKQSTEQKINEIKLERKIQTRRKAGNSPSAISKQLKLDLNTVLINTVDQYTAYAGTIRKWYNSKYEFTENDYSSPYTFDPSTLPSPTRPSYGLDDDDIVISRIGSCHNCGSRVDSNSIVDGYCLVCRVRNMMLQGDIPHAPEVEDDEENEFNPYSTL